MSDFNSLPPEASPQLTDNVFLARGSAAGAERAALLSAISALFAAEAQALTNKTSYNGVVLSGINTPQLAVNGTTSVAGTNTGDQTNITGNAATATALQTSRNINGVPFNGTVNITVTAAAGTLTGSTLAAGVTSSSLTSLGASPTLADPFITGTIGGTAQWPSSRVNGVIPIANLATGTPDGSKFIRDDGTLATPPGATGLFTGEALSISSGGTTNTNRPSGSRHHTVIVNFTSSSYAPTIQLNTNNSPQQGDVILVVCKLPSAGRTIGITFSSGFLSLFDFLSDLPIENTAAFEFTLNSLGDWALSSTLIPTVASLPEAFAAESDDYVIITGATNGSRRILASTLVA